MEHLNDPAAGREASMTEAEWVGGTDPGPMLEFLWASGKLPDRKARLFAVAAARRHWHRIKDERTRKALEAAEKFADGLSNREEYAAAAQAAGFEAGDVHGDVATFQAVTAVVTFDSAADEEGAEAAFASDSVAQAEWLRCVLGHPCRPLPVLPPALLGRSEDLVRKLAWVAYQERLLPSGRLDPARLSVLADALEEAGCADPAILGHLRDTGPHVRGCWPVDLLPGRS